MCTCIYARNAKARGGQQKMLRFGERERQTGIWFAISWKFFRVLRAVEGVLMEFLHAGMNAFLFEVFSSYSDLWCFARVYCYVKCELIRNSVGKVYALFRTKRMLNRMWFRSRKVIITKLWRPFEATNANGCFWWKVIFIYKYYLICDKSKTISSIHEAVNIACWIQWLTLNIHSFNLLLPRNQVPSYPLSP